MHLAIRVRSAVLACEGFPTMVDPAGSVLFALRIILSKAAANTGDEIIESAVVGARIGGLVSGLVCFEENAFRGNG